MQNLWLGTFTSQRDMYSEPSSIVTLRMSSLARIQDDNKVNSGVDKNSEIFRERTVTMEKRFRNTNRKNRHKRH